MIISKVACCVVSALAIVGLAACGTSGGAARVVTVTRTVSAPGAGPATDESDEPSEEPSDTVSADPGTIKFGQAYAYDDGLSIVVGKPKRFTPSDVSAGGDKQKYHVKFRITIENGTKSRFDTNVFSGDIQSGGAQGENVYDDGISDPSAVLLPGRSVTFTSGYGVDDPNDLVLTIGWLDEHDDVIYAN